MPSILTIIQCYKPTQRSHFASNPVDGGRPNDFFKFACKSYRLNSDDYVGRESMRKRPFSLYMRNDHQTSENSSLGNNVRIF